MMNVVKTLKRSVKLFINEVNYKNALMSYSEDLSGNDSKALFIWCWPFYISLFWPIEVNFRGIVTPKEHLCFQQKYPIGFHVFWGETLEIESPWNDLKGFKP